MAEKLLEVKNFSVSFKTYAGEVQAVRGVSFSVDAARLSRSSAIRERQSVMTQSLVKTSAASRVQEWRRGAIRRSDSVRMRFKQPPKVKGCEIAYVFQDPMTT
jgi:oligopeptide transport system ATP-binding protein